MFNWITSLFSEPSKVPQLKSSKDDKIKPGDTVTAFISGEERECVVLRMLFNGMVLIRRLGKTTAGRKYPTMQYHLNHLRLHRKYDPFTANVFADFLEENGYIEAAQLLRSKFPMVGIK
jgi:hypothetical protein